MMLRMTRELVHCHRHRYLLLDKTALFILLTRMGDDDDDDDGGDSKQNKVRQQLFLFIFDLDDECRSCRFPELKTPQIEIYETSIIHLDNSITSYARRSLEGRRENEQPDRPHLWIKSSTAYHLTYLIRLHIYFYLHGFCNTFIKLDS